MKLKKESRIYLVLLLFLLTSFIAYGLGVGEETTKTAFTDITNIPTQPEIPPQQLSTPLSTTTTGPVNTPIPEGTIITDSSGSIISNIAGSYKLLIMAGKLVGGVVVSSKDNNAVPAFNPLTGDIIIYNMGLGDTVTILQ